MTRALFWKEWRTQRSLVFAGLGLGAITPLFLTAGMMAASRNYDFGDLIAMLFPIFGVVIWPLFAAAIAGTAFATDMSDDSLRFLLSRPVSRARVWLVKVGAALAALVAVVVGTTLIGLLYAWLGADHLKLGRDIRAALRAAFEMGGLYAVLPFLFLFGCAIYCSIFVKRPMVAAVGGFAVAAGLSVGVGLIWGLVMPWAPASPAFAFFGRGIQLGIPLATIAIWIAAFWVFSRGDIFAGDVRKRALKPLAAIVAVVVLLGAGPAMWSGMQMMSQVASYRFGNLLLVDGAITLAERTPNGLSTHLKRVPVNGTGPVILPPEHATNPVVSPDGEWVVYVDHGGYWGMASGEIVLRAMRVDGSEDHAISGPLQWRWNYSPFTIMVAPDNDRVAYSGDQDLLLASISGGEEEVVDLDLTEDIGIAARDWGVIGWSTSDPSELLYYRIVNRWRGEPAPGSSSATRPGPAMRRTELLAYDPTNGESRLLREFPGRHTLRVWGSRWSYESGSAKGWAWLPAWIDDADADHMYAIDTVSADLVELSDSPCNLWGFSFDRRSILYANCSGQVRDGDGRMEIRVRDLQSGADEPFAVLENYDDSGNSRELHLSPDGERILMYARQYFGDWSTYLVSRGGEVRILDEDRLPVAWINDREVLLARFHLYWQPYLSVMNVDTGVIREIFP